MNTEGMSPEEIIETFTKPNTKVRLDAYSLEVDVSGQVLRIVAENVDGSGFLLIYLNGELIA